MERLERLLESYPKSPKGTKVFKKQIKEGWLAGNLEGAGKAFVGKVSAALEYGVEDARAFCVALLEDVNDHKGAEAVNNLLSKMSV